MRPARWLRWRLSSIWSARLLPGGAPAEMPADAKEKQQLRRPAARSFLLERPQRHGTADDGRERQRSEVAAVQRRRLVPVHDKDFALTECATALPGREQTTAAVVFARPAHLDPVDRYCEIPAADGLRWQCQNAFDERHAAWEISPIGEEGRQRLRRED